MSQENKSIHDVLRAAVTAQDEGVPVDWQKLCVDTINIATQEVTALEKANAELSNQLAVLQNPPEIVQDLDGPMQ